MQISQIQETRGRPRSDSARKTLFAVILTLLRCGCADVQGHFHIVHGRKLNLRCSCSSFDARPPIFSLISKPFQGTYPFGINTNGAITGWYVDATNVNHDFVRDKHGAIVEFDSPGAGTGPGQVWSIAPNGAVTGFFFDPNNVVHGLRARSGWGRVELTQIYRTVTPGRPMPLRKRHSLPEIIAHERLRPALTPVEV